MDQLAVTKTWLQSHCILVPNDWLQACIDWIQEENHGSGLTQGKLNDMVYEQWLLSDLHELGMSCLPVNLATDVRFNLIGTYALQIDSIVDVSQSYYSQQQKLKGTDNSNINVTAETSIKSWEPKPTRMLMLSLTDGSLEIKGMEYRSITQLNVTTRPGCKILVQGKILCRRGILLLTESSVKVLGGEVDTLIEQNTAENFLQQAVEKSSTNAGKQIKSEFEGSQIQRIEQTPNDAFRQNREIERKPHQNIKPAVDVCLGTNRPMLNKQAVMMKSSTSVLMEDDDQMWEDEFNFDELMEDERNQNKCRPTSKIIQPSISNSSIQRHNVRKSESLRDQGNKNSNHSKNGSFLVKKETEVTHASGFCDSDFDDDMYDFDMESAVRDDPLSSSSSANDKVQEVSSRNAILSRTSSQAGDEKKNIVTCSSSGSISKSTCTSGFVNKKEHNKKTFFKMKNENESKHSTCGLDSLEFDGSHDYESIVRDDPLLEGTSPSKRCMTLSTLQRLDVRAMVKPKDQNNSFSQKQVAKTHVYSLKKPIKIEKELPSYTSVSDMIEQGNSSSNIPENYVVLKQTRILKSSVVLSLREQYFQIQAGKQPSGTNIRGGTDSKPFTYLALVQERLPCTEGFHCRVKAYISTLSSRLDCDGGNLWHLTCKINDGSASLEVNLSNQVLTELIGFSAEESMIMRKRARQDPTVRDVLTKGLQQCQKKLIDLSCLMELEVSPHCKHPCIKTLANVTDSDIDVLYGVVTQRMNQLS